MVKKKRVLPTKKGFTLVELMIVVIVMAILVAVAIPVYASVTQNAEAKTCANNRRVISGLLTNYINGTYTGKSETIPNFQIHNENKLPVFYDENGGAPDASVLAVSVWLTNQEQDEASLCCVRADDPPVVWSAEVVASSVGGSYVVVTCSRHTS